MGICSERICQKENVLSGVKTAMGERTVNVIWQNILMYNIITEENLRSQENCTGIN